MAVFIIQISYVQVLTVLLKIWNLQSEDTHQFEQIIGYIIKINNHKQNNTTRDLYFSGKSLSIHSKIYILYIVFEMSMLGLM